MIKWAQNDKEPKTFKGVLKNCTYLILLNKMLWGLQIQMESLKTLLMCMCVLFSCFKLVNSLLKIIQAQLNLYLFEKMGFLKGCEISTCSNVESTGCLKLSGF